MKFFMLPAKIKAAFWGDWPFAAAAMSSVAWLPWLEKTSTIAALLLPIAGLLVAAAKLWTIVMKKPDVD